MMTEVGVLFTLVRLPSIYRYHHPCFLNAISKLTALMMTEVGVRTLKENPNNFAPSTKAPSSIFRKIYSKYRVYKKVENFQMATKLKFPQLL
jgi:hypothetical protein